MALCCCKRAVGDMHLEIHLDIYVCADYADHLLSTSIATNSAESADPSEKPTEMAEQFTGEHNSGAAAVINLVQDGTKDETQQFMATETSEEANRFPLQPFDSPCFNVKGAPEPPEGLTICGVPNTKVCALTSCSSKYM